MEACEKPRRLKLDEIKKNRASAKIWLDDVLREFNKKEFLKTDPIHIPHSYSEQKDQELSGLIVALFAFGNVKAIVETSRSVLKPLGRFPTETLVNMSAKDLDSFWRNHYYRFYSANDIGQLMRSLQLFLKNNETVGNGFRSLWNGNLMESLRAFRNTLHGEGQTSRGCRFMFADPEQSAAKRWHMFLRWMVRQDEIDFGHWSFIQKAQLVLPLDTHLFKISKKLRLTQLKSASLSAALEITEHFRKWDPDDPIKYDFALCRLGILKLL